MHRRLKRYAHWLCPVADVFAQDDWHWSIRQAEYSTDLMFRSQDILAPLYDAISRQAVLARRPALPAHARKPTLSLRMWAPVDVFNLDPGRLTDLLRALADTITQRLGKARGSRRYECRANTESSSSHPRNTPPGNVPVTMMRS